MGLEMGESLKGDACCVEDDLLNIGQAILHCQSLLLRSYSEDVRVGAAPSVDHIELICTLA